MSLRPKDPQDEAGSLVVVTTGVPIWLRTALIVISVACFAFRMSWFSCKNMLWADEFCSWSVISDTSLHHALAAWKSGADSGGVLFYLLSRLIVKVTGLHPEAIRVYSGLCFVGASYCWYRYLKPNCGTLSTIAGLSAIYLGSPLVAYHSEELRFYGQFYLAFSWLLTYLLQQADKKERSKGFVLKVFMLGSFLVLSQTIGAIYVALVILCVCVTSSFSGQRVKVAAALASTLGWLAIFKGAVASQSKISWIQPPSLLDFLRYYLKNPFVGKLSGIAFYLLLLGVWLFDANVRQRLRVSLRNRSFAALSMAALALVPPVAAVSAHFATPMTADRYLMPYLGFCTVALCFSLHELRRLPSIRRLSLTVRIVVCGSIIGGLFVTATASVPRRPVESLQALADWPTSGVVVLDDTNLLFQLQYYYPAEAKRYFAAYPKDVAQRLPRPGTMVLADNGYLRNVESTDEVLCKDGWVYLLRSGYPKLDEVPLPPGVDMQPVKTLKLAGDAVTFYRISYGLPLCHEVASLPLFEERF